MEKLTKMKKDIEDGDEIDEKFFSQLEEMLMMTKQKKMEDRKSIESFDSGDIFYECENSEDRLENKKKQQKVAAIAAVEADQTQLEPF